MVILTTGIGTFAFLASLYEIRVAKHHAEESCRDWASAVGYGIQAMVDASQTEEEGTRLIGEFLERQRGHSAMMGLQAFDGHLREAFPSQRFPVLNPIHNPALLTAIKAGRDTSYYEPDGILLNHVQPVWTLGPAGTTGGMTWGAVRVTMSMAEEWRRIRRTAITLLSGGLIAVVVTGLLLSRWLRKVVVRPIEQTESTLTALAQGDTKARVSWTSDDELGSLARHVNQMADALAHQRELEVRLVHLSKLSDIGALAQGIAHNLRSPLTAIRGFAELIQMKHPDLQELKTIVRSADQIEDIVGNIMYKSRQEQRRDRQSIDLNRLLREELKFLEADSRFKHQTEKVYRFADDLPTVEGVYSDFSQCFTNLIRNSLDAMHKSDRKQLTVETEKNGDSVIVLVSDTGSGIQKEHLDRIFEPFFTTKPLAGEAKPGEPTGTGLGLSTCVQLLKPYGAEIAAESEVGVGTTFSVRIPTKNGNSGGEMPGGCSERGLRAGRR
jgi:signal transduction histidine kinase